MPSCHFERFHIIENCDDIECIITKRILIIIIHLFLADNVHCANDAEGFAAKFIHLLNLKEVSLS